MEASLTYYPAVLVISRSDQPGQNYDAKSVPLCLVRSVRLCHSYSVTRDLVRVSRKRYQILCRMVRRYVSWTHVLSNVSCPIAIEPTWTEFDAKRVPLCLVRSVRLCHSYSVTRNLVRVSRKRYQILCRMVKRYVSWTHVPSNGIGHIAIEPTWSELRREKCSSMSGTQFPTVL
jgi:hypothetical protein